MEDFYINYRYFLKRLIETLLSTSDETGNQAFKAMPALETGEHNAIIAILLLM